MMGVFVQLNTDSIHATSKPVGYVIAERGCWEWVGTTNLDGYGRMYVAGRLKQAHREMYERVNGPITTGLTLDHLCRNRVCINPDHLEAVPHRVNVLRGNGWAGKHARQTHCSQGHPLSGDNLVAAESLRGSRRCRICWNDKCRSYMRRKRAALKQEAK